MTATVTNPPQASDEALDGPSADKANKSPLRYVVDVLGSMKLAVVLLAMLALLT